MRILEVCVDLDGGGIDRYLLNYCSRIDGIQFDFAIIDKEKKGILEEPILALGGKIFKIPRQKSGLTRNYQALKKILTENDYQAVHIHLGEKSLIALLCAYRCGIKTRIVHAHIAFVPESRKERIIRKILTVPVKILATSLTACGEDAARWVWGNRAFERKRVTVHNNAIQLSRFRFSVEERQRLRQELGIKNKSIVFGHVGRMCDQKNQLRLLDIFAEIIKRVPDASLLLIGRGEMEKEVVEKIQKLQLSDQQVKILGIRDDVNLLLNAMDAFVFPSKYEGLPFTLIETQSNGLPAVSSDIVTPQIKLTDCLSFLPLNSSDAVWAERAIQIAGEGHDENAWKRVQAAGYDIDVEAKKLKDFYLACIEGKR